MIIKPVVFIALAKDNIVQNDVIYINAVRASRLLHFKHVMKYILFNNTFKPNDNNHYGL